MTILESEMDILKYITKQAFKLFNMNILTN